MIARPADDEGIVRPGDDEVIARPGDDEGIVRRGHGLFWGFETSIRNTFLNKEHILTNLFDLEN